MTDENRKQAEALFESGRAKAKAGDYQNAIEGYTKAIKLDPDYAEAYSYRGLLHNQDLI